MGSLTKYRPPGMTDQAFFENEFGAALTSSSRIVACASKPAKGDWDRVFYAAVHNNDDAPDNPGKTWCLIILMDDVGNSDRGTNFRYSIVPEKDGPYESTCPDRILNLLSPAENLYARDWRERCRAYNASGVTEGHQR